MPSTSTRSRQLSNTQPSFCQTLHLTEENIRFVLLAILLYIYLCVGAFIFQAVEEPAEEQMRENYEITYNKFLRRLTLLNEASSPSYSQVEVAKEKSYMEIDEDLDYSNEKFSTHSDPQISEDDLLNLLYVYGNATKGGAFQRKRWDWVGSFHFAWTIVSTIGYGATTPKTTAGQLLIIPYGFLGCSGGLLFFNLFLERIITFLASCMRYYRIHRQKRRSVVQRGSVRRVWKSQNGRRSSQSSVENSPEVEEDWKPSVYWVMVCLLVMSATVIVGSAGLFHSMERWTFTESLYFSFVSYATIGFGDYVSLQQVSYGPGEVGYRVGAFAILILGCCCIYSLLNVTSIVIKQSLNWMIRRLGYVFCNWFRFFPTSMNRRLSQYRSRIRRANLDVNGGELNSGQRTQVSVIRLQTSEERQAQHNSIEMDDHERRYSAENMVSIHNEHNSKVSFAVMQKRLYETAQMSKSGGHQDNTQSIGPLAIVTERLNDTSQNND